jgi:excisionase family DNA binding protein
MWFTLLPDGDVRPACQERGYGMRQVYTTYQAAKLLRVGPRTIARWFDAGRLRGYRAPGSQIRRIPREALVAFIMEHGLTLPAELTKGQEESAEEAVS